MRYGLSIPTFGIEYTDPGVLAGLARDAEDAGWEAFFVWDHLSFAWGPPACDPWIALAAAAVATSTILLGTAITPVPRRRPHVLAHQVASLARLSGGRAILGAGVGGIESEFAVFGENAAWSRRGELLDAGLDAIRTLWAKELAGPTGRIPVWVGGNSPPALRRAARHDGWIACSTDPTGMVMSPEEVGKLAAGLPEHVEVAVLGYSKPGDKSLFSSYAHAGATWWLETFHDNMHPLTAARARILGGA